MPKMIDLFSGLGGASQAFVDAGWQVLRIENNPLLEEVPHTRLMDIYDFRDWVETTQAEYPEAFEDIELIWASPPCHEFSLGFSAPKAIHSREHPNTPYYPNLDMLEVAVEIIEMIKPRYHIIENVRGACPHFLPIIGKYRQQFEAYFLWGNYPSFCPEPFPSKSEKDKRHSPLRANIKGKVPIEISEALLASIKNQKSIYEWVIE
jgi:site-specific DNA-cytosine methylase|tara:strand:- start:525 stop:1142 length:618 start_codon:yes stop_codon:yes gene_type:complete